MLQDQSFECARTRESACTLIQSNCCIRPTVIYTANAQSPIACRGLSPSPCNSCTGMPDCQLPSSSANGQCNAERYAARIRKTQQGAVVSRCLPPSSPHIRGCGCALSSSRGVLPFWTEREELHVAKRHRGTIPGMELGNPCLPHPRLRGFPNCPFRHS